MKLLDSYWNGFNFAAIYSNVKKNGTTNYMAYAGDGYVVIPDCKI
jgi:hypothetical protein